MAASKWNLSIQKNIDGIFWRGDSVSLTSSSAVAFADGKDTQWTFKVRRTSQNAALFCDTAIEDDFIDNSGKILLTRTVCYNNCDHSCFYVGLSLINGGDAPIRLERLTPLALFGEDSLMLDSEYKNWLFLRQGRHKNDIPSVCVLGEADNRYLDALKGMTESGSGAERIKGVVPTGVVSDELTVIKSQDGLGKGSVTLGFLPCTSQLVSCDIYGNENRGKLEKLELYCLMDGITVDPGEGAVSEWLRVDGNTDALKAIDDYVKVRAELSKSRENIHPPMSIYFTWYFYGDSVREVDVLENLRYIAKNKIPTDSFQIDAGWETRWGDWEANPSFPSGMKFIAGQISAAGMIPGIWTSPFIAEPRSKLIYEHPDWLLQKEDGTPARFKMMAMDNFVLDITHPEVLEWLEKLFHKMRHEWGYTYHKLDFTRAAVDKGAAYYDKKVTRAQAYRNAIAAIRRGIGDDAFLAICGGLFGAPAGLVDSHRTSSDVRSEWPKPDDGETESAASQVKQNIMRYWMNGLWHNDPDALMVRRRKERYKSIKFTPGLLTDDEAEVFALNQYWSGGLMAYTEPMNEIDADRLALLRRAIPAGGNAAIPRDMFGGGRYPSVMDTCVNWGIPALGEWHTVSLVNWSNAPKTKEFVLDDSFVGSFAETGKEYVVSEYFTGKVIRGVNYGDRLAFDIKPHCAAQLRIAVQNDDAPMLVCANGHLSMGAAEITAWEYDGEKLAIGVNWKWENPLEIKIRLPKGKSATVVSVLNGAKVNTAADIVLLHFTTRFAGNICFSIL